MYVTDIHTHICTSVCKHAHTFIYTHLNTNVETTACLYTYICIDKHTHNYIHVSITEIHVMSSIQFSCTNRIPLM